MADRIWPPRSLLSAGGTDRTGTVEPELWRALDRLVGPVCIRCGVPLPEAVSPEVTCGACLADPPLVARARAALAYDDISRPLVLALKHAGRRDGLAAFAAWMDDAAPFAREAGVLVPVPSHRWRLLARGFNPAAWLATALGRRIGVAVCVDGLEKPVATASQAGRGRQARRDNVAGAFRVRRHRLDALRGQAIVVVDDVHTTGATLDACAAALLEAGAARVDAVTLARAVSPPSRGLAGDEDGPVT